MTTASTVTWDALRDGLLSDSAVKAEYDALEPEFNLARHIIALRQISGLNQRDFAERVGIKQPQLARLESGKQMPKLETLIKLAAGAGYRLEVHFVPAQQNPASELDPLQLSLTSTITNSPTVVEGEP